MKKLLLYALGAMMSMSAYAQEDVTNYIQNAGFDEDLTWQADGSKKETIGTQRLSDRSIAAWAADSSVYATVNPSTPKSRPDGRTFEATNGFKGRIKGWTLETNGAFPSCEWTYFGSLPYELADQAIPVADDGNTYITVPARPTEFDGGNGFIYLRAGWTNSAAYKQVVKLPCAKYRLEYWTININPNTSSVAKDLTQIVCRKDVFKDESGTGLSAQEWTKHEFEFTPTAEFTMQFGYEAANAGSGGQPIVGLDGIKLYKIGDANPIELLVMDITDLQQEAYQKGCHSLSALLTDFAMDVEEMDDPSQEELAAVEAKLESFRQILASVADIESILSRMNKLSASTDYPGKKEFDAAYARIQGYLTNSDYPENLVELLLGAVAEAKAAIKAYTISQQGSVENPADFTALIQNPWFIDASAEPELKDGVWEFPKRYDEDGNELYVEGSASSPDLTSEGWKITGEAGGDQRLNWQRGRSCWNAWRSDFTSVIAVGQEITGLPNGYYTVAADMITQSGMLSDQHVYAESIAEKKISQALSSDDYDGCVWETLQMTADQKVLVVDNKLTIGAEGTGSGSGAQGWFLVTNFHLYYLGEAPAEAVKAALDAKIAYAKEVAADMHFKADQKTLNDTIALYENSTDYLAGLNALAVAIPEAEKSEALYAEYYSDDTKTLPTVDATLNGETYGAANDIVKYAYDYVITWIGCDTATYTKFEATVNLLKNYVNTYAPVYNEAAEVAASAAEAGKVALNNVMAAQKKELTAGIKELATIQEYVEKLKSVMIDVKKQNIVDDPDATDFTEFILNPTLAAETGWDFEKGNGNNNTGGGQWFDDSSTRYIDSYNSAGLVGYKATQLVKNLPNGTYKMGVYTRTPAEGAYVLYATGADTTFVEIPLHYYATQTEAGEDTTVVASDSHGPLWEAAIAAVDAGTASELEIAIADANTGNGRGWKYQEMEGIKVTDHKLLIGVMTGTEASKTEKVFGGSWFSAGGWTLTLVEKGDNSGWEGPLAEGIEEVKNGVAAIDGIYTLTGVKAQKLQRGLNIVIRNGKSQKIFVK